MIKRNLTEKLLWGGIALLFAVALWFTHHGNIHVQGNEKPSDYLLQYEWANNPSKLGTAYREEQLHVIYQDTNVQDVNMNYAVHMTLDDGSSIICRDSGLTHVDKFGNIVLQTTNYVLKKVDSE